MDLFLLIRLLNGWKTSSMVVSTACVSISTLKMSVSKHLSMIWKTYITERLRKIGTMTNGNFDRIGWVLKIVKFDEFVLL